MIERGPRAQYRRDYQAYYERRKRARLAPDAPIPTRPSSSSRGWG